MEFIPSLNNYHPLNIIELNSTQLIQNLKNIQLHLENKDVFPVLKSNAYGHGIQEIYKILQNEIRKTYVCVDSLAEAFEIFKIDNAQKILVMGYVDPQNLNIKKLPFDFVVWSIEQIKQIAKFQPSARFHLFIDTGMNREGLKIFELQNFFNSLTSVEKDKIVGLMSHFASADEISSKLNEIQIQNFEFAQDITMKACRNIRYTHIGASSAIERKLAFDVSNSYRAGLSLYGFSPINEKSSLTSPVLNLYSHISQIKFVNIGEHIGYNSTVQVKQNMILAILPIGYNDGIDRRLSNIGFVKVKDIYCPIVGRISMNITAIDITEAIKIYDIQVGEKVQIISSNPDDKNSFINIAKSSSESIYVNLIHLNPSTRREIILTYE